MKTTVRGGGFLPPTAQYLDPWYSKHPEATALLAGGLTWIQKLLRKFPNHSTDTNPPPLLIPVGNDGVVNDVHPPSMHKRQPTTYSAPTSTYFKQSELRNSTNYLSKRTLRTLRDTKTDKLWHELDIREKINVLADRQANAIYTKKPLRLVTGLFPTRWISGTRAALFHGEQQVTKGIPAYIRDAAHMPALKEYLLIRCSKEATGRD
jgi:hypothetical protein